MAIPKKPRKCRVCKTDFQPSKPLQNVCGPECALIQAKAKRAKADRIAGIEDRKVIKAKLEAIKPRSYHMRQAQKAFNAWVRMRSMIAGHACISSGRPLDWNGNGVDAGHYRSVGSAPHLRFNEDNCWAQSKKDNRYGSGAAVDYRIGLIARIGLERVEALEADNEPRKYSIEELKAIKAHYIAKLKELKHG
jgi:hypothetical protein